MPNFFDEIKILLWPQRYWVVGGAIVGVGILAFITIPLLINSPDIPDDDGELPIAQTPPVGDSAIVSVVNQEDLDSIIKYDPYFYTDTTKAVFVNMKRPFSYKKDFQKYYQLEGQPLKERVMYSFWRLHNQPLLKNTANRDDVTTSLSTLPRNAMINVSPKSDDVDNFIVIPNRAAMNLYESDENEGQTNLMTLQKKGLVNFTVVDRYLPEDKKRQYFKIKATIKNTPNRAIALTRINRGRILTSLDPSENLDGIQSLVICSSDSLLLEGNSWEIDMRQEDSITIYLMGYCINRSYLAPDIADSLCAVGYRIVIEDPSKCRQDLIFPKPPWDIIDTIETITKSLPRDKNETEEETCQRILELILKEAIEHPVKGLGHTIDTINYSTTDFCELESSDNIMILASSNGRQYQIKLDNLIINVESKTDGTMSMTLSFTINKYNYKHELST